MSGYYPANLTDFSENVPWNEPYIPEKDFEITCSQSLSRTAEVWTSNYVPGASGCDYEPDGEGGYATVGWKDGDDTSDTIWSKEYAENGYKTPLELIGMLKEYLEKDLREIQKDMLPNDRSFKATQVRMLKGLIKECDCWTEDETEFSE